jgi:hypothetical protein
MKCSQQQQAQRHLQLPVAGCHRLVVAAFDLRSMAVFSHRGNADLIGEAKKLLASKGGEFAFEENEQ